MRLEIDIAEHHYNNIMALDSVSLGRVPYKGIIMYSINAIKHGKVLEQEPTTKENLAVDCISRKQAVETIQKYGVGCFDADEFSPEECERFVIAKLNELSPISPQEPRWIPVSEKLPEPDVEVLVTDDAGGLATISTDSIYESEVTGEKEWYISQRVTAWMPLPKPYKEVEE